MEESRAILSPFWFHIIPDTFLEVPLVKVFIDGPAVARHSRFSFVRQETARQGPDGTLLKANRWWLGGPEPPSPEAATHDP